MMTYFGFAIADSMFPESATVTRRPLSAPEVRALIETGVQSALNPSHAATIAAMRERFALDVPIPENPPRVTLGDGDRIIVMSVRGLPRLTDRREYTAQEIEAATFAFGLWEVAELPF